MSSGPTSGRLTFPASTYRCPPDVLVIEFVFRNIDAVDLNGGGGDFTVGIAICTFALIPTIKVPALRP